MIRWLLRLLFPPKCAFCGTITENETFAVCDRCLEKAPKNIRACTVCGTPLDTIYGPCLCTRCIRHRRPFQRAYVPLVYKNEVRNAILGFKFGGKRARSATFATYIFLKMREKGAECPDVITYVPMHFIRLGKRGYNQSALLARALGKMMQVPVRPLLRKKKHTPPQSMRSGWQRKNAQRDAFALRRRAKISGERILLIDDVVTTGATLSACARLLKAGGAKTVEIAAVAATPYMQK